MFWTVKAKVAVTTELEAIAEDEKAKFIERKKSEVDSIMQVSLKLEQHDLITYSDGHSTPKNVRNGPARFKQRDMTSWIRSGMNVRTSESILCIPLKV